MVRKTPARGSGANSKRVLFVTHPACAGHKISHHPEQPKRVEAIEAAVLAHYADDAALARTLAHDSAPAGADDAALARFHSAKHIKRLAGLFARVEAAAAAPIFDPRSGRRGPRRTTLSIDEDTAVMPKSRLAARHAASGAMRAVDAVLGGEGFHSAFACVRPPGHHATPTQAMGFCLFNNVGVAALHARAAHGCQRVAVVDVDVHHGNGTEAFFRDDADLFYASFHQAGDDFYPGTGLAAKNDGQSRPGRAPRVVNGARVAGETGTNGNVVNCPLPKGAGIRGVRSSLEDKILPKLQAFEPGLVILSLGFDALAADPIGGLNLDPRDYAYITRAVHDACPGAKFVSVLEGGYDVREISRGAVAHVGELSRLATGASSAERPSRRPRGASVISEMSSGDSWGSEPSDDESDEVSHLVATMSLDSIDGTPLKAAAKEMNMSLDSIADEPPTPPETTLPRRSPRGLSPGELMPPPPAREVARAPPRSLR
mmetsp:Transcript_6330/g.19972  ORF Transcript_6330/g.19972 Transcript_6330/m.19972 type:complete len:487 (-) Transcript_6330:21-1481(-)